MTRYLDLAEYLWLAEQVIGVDAATRYGLPRAIGVEREVDLG